MEDEAPFASARRVLEEGLRAGAYGGAVALVLHRGAVVAEMVLGDAESGPHARPMRADTIFDLASLTKVIAGTTAALLLLERGHWALDEPVAAFIPTFGAHGKDGITLRHLLTHTTGLAAWEPLYLSARTASAAFDALCALAPEAAPGECVVYSDLGMALVAFLVERVCGESMPALLAGEVFEPLGMRDTGFLPAAARRARCAATTVGNEHEVEMLAARGAHFADWRTGLLVGEVHDGNTHYALEGVSSHAGLFATARDLASFAAMYLAAGAGAMGRILAPGTVRLATRPHTAHPGLAFGLGWRVAGSPMLAPGGDPLPGNFMGDLVSARAFGHTGFTGTSLVIDPDRDLAMILLTNAVHSDPSREGIARVRPRFHNAICAAIDGLSEPFAQLFMRDAGQEAE